MIIIAVSASIAATTIRPVETLPIPEGDANCFGAAAMLSTGDCVGRFDVPATADFTAAGQDLDTANWCLTWYDQDWNSCTLGDRSDSAKGTVALVGDSYAASWTAAFQYFKEQGWKLFEDVHPVRLPGPRIPRTGCRRFQSR